MPRSVRRYLHLAMVTGLMLTMGGLPGNAAGAGDRSGHRWAEHPHRQPESVVTAMVELDTPTAAAAVRGAQRAKADSRAVRSASQSAVERSTNLGRAVRAELARTTPSARVLYQSSRLYAGLAMTVKKSELASLRKIPGVRAVRLVTAKYRENSIEATKVQAPRAWEQLAGGTGAGVQIGIIDSGIDYTHATFGGAGTASAYQLAQSSSTFSPTAKVVGGWDFAGDDYDPGTPGREIPQPDANPLDCDGHGTHVAATAAGYGVTAQGQRFGTGQISDYSNAVSTPNWAEQFGTGNIGVAPGMAPLAELYALRIFGCTGGSGLIIPALERSADPNGDGDISDHLDIVNMSLGGDFGSPEDPDSVAANNAVAAGIVVVAAMGNIGDVTDSGSAPANAQNVIAVGASDENDVLAEFSSRGGRNRSSVKPDVTAPGVDVRSASVGTGTGSRIDSGTSMATPVVAGQAAIVRAEHPYWSPEEVKAAIVNSAGQDVRLSPAGEFAGATAAGSGRVNVAAAAMSSTLVLNSADPGSVSVSFGEIAAVTDQRLEKTVRVINHAEVDQVYNVDIRNIAEVPGVVYETSLAESGNVLSVPGGSSREFTLRLVVNRNELRSSANSLAKDTYPISPIGTANATPRSYVSQALSRLEVTDPAGRVHRLPVAATVRPASALSASDPVPGQAATFSAGSTGFGYLKLAGLDITQPAGSIGQVSARGQGFGLAAVSGQLPACPAATSCIPYSDAGSADIRYVGVTSNLKPVVSESYFDAKDESLTTFAISTWKPWATAEGYTMFEVFIDADRNGTPDFVVFNSRSYYNEDVFTAQLDSITATGERVPVDVEPLNGLHSNGTFEGYGGVDIPTFDTDTLTLPVFTSLLTPEAGGLAKSRFNYWVKSTSLAVGEMDTIGTPTRALTFDALRPAMRVAPTGIGMVPGDSTYPETTGKYLTLAKYAPSYAYDGALGVMLVHFHNGHGARAQVKSLRQLQAISLPSTLTTTHRQSSGSFSLGAVSSSGLAVSISAGPSSVCATASGRIYPRGSGYCTVTMSQAGNSQYLPTTVTRRFVIQGATKVSLYITDSTLTTGQTAIVTAQVSRYSSSSVSLYGGVVRFYDGSRWLATRTIPSSGRVAIYLPRRSAGTHYLRAIYYGSSWYSPSGSSWLRVSVR